jgi:DNA-binding GntR family transcriptional regulator
VADHAAVRNAIVRHHADGARVAMRRIIGDVLELIVRAETAKQKGTR